MMQAARMPASKLASLNQFLSKLLPAKAGVHGLPSVGYVPPVGANAMTISEAERRRFASGR